jgi:GTPase
MALPVIAIVGRPNVGKSSLLNRLAGRRISIVDPTAGVTRDRVSAVVELNGRYMELVDTGGYGIEDQDDLTDHIRRQITLALERADLVLFVVDIRDGAVTLDKQVAELLRKRNPNVLVIANKSDNAAMDNQTGDFFQLGFGKPVCISALHGRNSDTLAEQILAKLPPAESGRPRDAAMILAVVGKRNVGKSTFINALVGEERMIVSEVPGTTRDAVDIRFEIDGRTFMAIDTAGVRKKGKMANDQIEFYSSTRAKRSIQRADVVLLFLDATSDISKVDKQLARQIADWNKPCIIVVNKWDLAKEQSDTDAYAKYIQRMLPGVDYAPISFITASEGKNVQSLINLATELYKQATAEITTRQLNKAIETIAKERTPSVRTKIGFPRIYYGTQIATRPPTLLLFVNHPDAFDDNYRRFLINRLRDLLPFPEIPIVLLLRHHRESRGTSEPHD